MRYVNWRRNFKPPMAGAMPHRFTSPASGWFARLARLLTEPSKPAKSGTVWLVGAGPGAPDLLTVRALRVLQEADIVLHDALVASAILDLVPPSAQRVNVGKRKGAHDFTQREIGEMLVREGRAGRRVVRLKAGDPLVFGRAGEEMAALAEAGIPVEIVPGVTAALAAAADAKVPLTLRGVASSLAFVTAQEAEGADPQDWTALAATGATLAVYMGRSAGETIRRRLMDAGMKDTTPVVAVENAGRPERRILGGTVADLPALGARADLAGPLMIIVGPAVAQATVDPVLVEAIDAFVLDSAA